MITIDPGTQKRLTFWTDGVGDPLVYTKIVTKVVPSSFVGFARNVKVHCVLAAAYYLNGTPIRPEVGFLQLGHLNYVMFQGADGRLDLDESDLLFIKPDDSAAEYKIEDAGRREYNWNPDIRFALDDLADQMLKGEKF